MTIRRGGQGFFFAYPTEPLRMDHASYNHLYITYLSDRTHELVLMQMTCSQWLTLDLPIGPSPNDTLPPHVLHAFISSYFLLKSGKSGESCHESHLSITVGFHCRYRRHCLQVHQRRPLVCVCRSNEHNCFLDGKLTGTGRRIREYCDERLISE